MAIGPLPVKGSAEIGEIGGGRTTAGGLDLEGLLYHTKRGITGSLNGAPSGHRFNSKWPNSH